MREDLKAVERPVCYTHLDVYKRQGYFNKNSIGNITAIVTTTLGDVENAAARVLVSVLGGFFNSVALVIVLLVFDWRIGLCLLYTSRCV